MLNALHSYTQMLHPIQDIVIYSHIKGKLKLLMDWIYKKWCTHSISNSNHSTVYKLPVVSMLIEKVEERRTEDHLQHKNISESLDDKSLAALIISDLSSAYNEY